MTSYEFKQDEYKDARGGWSRLLNILCRKCGNRVLVYQKDGPGELRRLYFDRIFDPPAFAHLSEKSIDNINSLKCEGCNCILGTPYIYPKENRKAFRLYVGAITKEIRKLKE